MIKDIISFELDNQNFVIDFQKTPIILAATDHIPVESNKLNSNLIGFTFENEYVKFIDITESPYPYPRKIFPTSRILVGDYNGKLFGIVVDKVLEIINLNGEYENKDFIPNASLNNSVEKYLEISGEKYVLVDVEELLKKKLMSNADIR